MKRILYYCSSNPGKLREFSLAAQQAADLHLQIEPLPQLRHIPPPSEDGTTFEENATAKALYYSQFTTELVFADDSGLEVDALGGSPGVCSARFAGSNATDAANNDLLLRRLAGSTDRGSRFVCVLGLAQAGRSLVSFRGVVEGEILFQLRGESGFGYDPLFFYAPLNRSFGELASDQKFAVSHRGQALAALFQYLRSTVPG